MIYPTFDVNSIKSRCKSDLMQFYTTYKINPQDPVFQEVTSFNLYEDPSMDKQTMQANIQDKLDMLLKLDGTDIKSFDYAHNVIHQDDITQKKMWIVRTFIFYQLLLYVTITLMNPGLYNQVYSDTSKFPFREDVIDELNTFQMGIFGSITPQSDIDIGIQYSGSALTKPALAYVVSRFENSFLEFTTLNSLQFDIETYADMMTLTKEIGQKGGRKALSITSANSNKALPLETFKAESELLPTRNTQDYFYLDTSNFSLQHFQKTLICAGTSILRNAVLFQMDVLGRSLTNEEIVNIVTNYNISDAMNINEVFGYFYNDIKGDLTTDWLEKAKPIVIDYMTSNYDSGRYRYYDLVNIAEQGKFEATSLPGILTPDVICDLIVNIGMALTYRMESYTCAPTVIHVVRILQASKKDAEKYKTITPRTYCVGEIKSLDPFCSIGKYGYALSCLEQIGYVYRFYNTYCIEGTHYNKAKCDKKLLKYVTRFENGYFFFVQYNTTFSLGGGKAYTRQKFMNMMKRRKQMRRRHTGKKKKTISRRIRKKTRKHRKH